MGLKKKPQMVEAVLFFNEQGGISKQMMFTEFEALLDGVVNIIEFADQQIKAAYVVITPRLQIKSLVCFCLDFDEAGAPDQGWNLPLQSLADNASRGPDLGAGPIRLVTQSNCPVAAFTHFLWEPDLTKVPSDFACLAEAVSRNTLGLLLEEEPRRTAQPAEQTGENQLRAEREQRLKNAELLKQQRQLVNTINQQHEEELARVRADAQHQAQALQAQIATLQQGLAQQQAENSVLQAQLVELQAQLDTQTASFQASRQEMGEQLRSLEQDARQHEQELRARFEVQLQDALNKALAQHQEQIAIRDVEMNYLHEQDAHNQNEIRRLTQVNAELINEGGLRYLESLNALGVMFVVYHPGAGHLTIPLPDIGLYQENPLAYAASKCFVSEEQYRLWVEHYQEPTCSAVMPNGERCAIPLDRVDVPGRFVAGESNCCSRHQLSARMRTTA